MTFAAGGPALRRANLHDAADLAALAEIELAAFDDPWPLKALAELGDQPGMEAWLAFDAAQAGIASALFRNVPAAGEAELLRVATLPGWRRRGVADALLAAAFAELDGAGAACFLEVRADNLAAQELYRRHGFACSQVRPGYYRDGSDAWLFSRAAGGSRAG